MNEKKYYDIGIVLGPILGIESETKYTICILIDNKVISKNEVIKLYSKSGEYYPILTELKNFSFLRFEIEVIPEDWKRIIIDYCFKIGEILIGNKYNIFTFEFEVPSKNAVPNIVFASCNGSHKKYPNNIHPDNWKGWNKINEVKPDLIILNGDQIYADEIWNKLKNIKQYTKHLQKQINVNDLDKIDEFYLQLYIDSWSYKDMAICLSKYPTIMNWDDHDIIDGYGSYDKLIQDSTLLKAIFQSAKKYYLLFQLRGKDNISLIKPGSLSSIFQWRNYIFILPDTRSNRTTCQIIPTEELNDYKSKLKPFYNSSKDVIFVIPVPLAHRDYNGAVEKIISRFTYFRTRNNPFKGLIKGSLEDDAIDHWDHNNHTKEHQHFLEWMFDQAEKINANYMLIISGDVHSAGAAKITYKKNNNQNKYSTQLISSPLVNNPITSIQSFAVSLSSRNRTMYDKFDLELIQFGTFKKIYINQRNFIKIYKPRGKGLNSAIYYEINNEWQIEPEYRNLNLFN